MDTTHPKEIDMKYFSILFSIAVLLITASIGFAGDAHEGHDMKAMDESPGKTGDTYKHEAVTEGIRAEFEVMSLASMNMKDDSGATHHVMLKLFHDDMNHQIKKAKGKIKIIGPDKKEQISVLKDYIGIYASNFTFGQSGKYGIICLVKIDDKKRVFKFWYDHKG